MKILIADDHDAEMLGLIFEEAGWDALTAKDGRDALLVYHQSIQGDHYFDVLLLDVEMPRLNGFVVGLNVRNLETCGHIPRAKHIYLTGHEDVVPPKDLLDSRWMGEIFADGYIRKPIDADGLIDRINELVETDAKRQ